METADFLNVWVIEELSLVLKMTWVIKDQSVKPVMQMGFSWGFKNFWMRVGDKDWDYFSSNVLQLYYKNEETYQLWGGTSLNTQYALNCME